MPNFQQIFGWLFVAAGAYEILWCIRKLWRGQGSHGWPIVEGEVVSTDIASRSESGDGFGVEYSPRIRYTYRVAGTPHRNEMGRYSLIEEWGTKEWAEDIVRRFGTGKVRVYYDPKNPSTSVLQQGVHWSYWFMIPCCLVLVVIGLLMTEVWR